MNDQGGQMRRKGILSSDDLMMSPGTYFNPVNEMIVVVDDTNYLDMSDVDLSGFNGDDWVLVADEPLIDSTAIEDILQLWQTGGGVESYQDISETGKDQQSKSA
jgi:hypothetical protein